MDEKGTAFWEWLKANGAEISDKISLHDYSSEGQGRGVIALDDIDKDELLFSIPRNFVMSVDNDEKYSDLVSGENDNGPWLNLMTYMMICANKDHWKPYFDVLPALFNTPMFWDEKTAKDLLQGSALIEKIGKSEAEEQWKELKSLFDNEMFKGTDTSVDAFHRMGSIIMSYSFDIKPIGQGEEQAEEDGESDQENEEEAVKAMVPLADMLNAHTRLCNAHLCHTDDNKSLEMRSIKKIPKGNQVYNTYGELPNSDLLRRYGYAESGGTEYDVVEVSTSLFVDALVDTLNVDKAKIDKVIQAMEEDNDFYDESYDIGFNGEPDLGNLIILEYLTMVNDVENTERLLKQCVKIAEDEKLTDRSQKVWLKLLELRMQQYPERIREEAARNPNPEPKDDVVVDIKKMADEILLGEVRILQRCQNWVKEVDIKKAEDVLDKVANPPKKQKT